MIPQTKYLEAGPALPQASQAAAQAQADALARFGTTIAAVGERGFQIAERVRKTEEAGTMAAYFANIDEEAGKFSNDLLNRTDPSEWPKDWRKQVDDFKSQAANLKLSNEARSQLNLQIQDWSTQRTIRFEGLAASRTVDEARARIDMGFNHAISRGEREQAEQYLGLMPSAGLMPSQVDSARMSMERGLARQTLAADAASDPTGTIERVNSKDYLKQEGNEHLTLEDLDFARDQAHQSQRLLIGNANAEFQDLAATGEIRTKEDLNARFGTTLPPRVIEAMESDLANRWNAKEIDRRATPAYQTETIGAIEAALPDLPIEVDKFPEKLVQLESLARTLPTGAARTRLLERIDNVAQGKRQDFKSAADLAREDLTTLYKNQYFGDIELEQSTTSILDAGFLRNPKNLTEDGFSQEQADTITGTSINKQALRDIGRTDDEIKSLTTKPLTDSVRTELFRAMRQKRPGKSKLTGYKAEAADLIARGQGTMKRTDSGKLAEANSRLGKATQELDQWLSANPSKIDDFEAIETKKNEIIDRHSVNGFAIDFIAPSVLPPISPAAEVPDFLDQ